MWTISAWISDKLNRNISFKIYFRLSQVLKFKSCINSLNGKLEKSLDEKEIVGAVLMDLSNAFDSIPYDVLIAKMHAYSYLKRRKQNVGINNTHSLFKILLFGVFQGSIPGSLLFNIHINDLYLWASKTDLLNFSGDNTISAAENTIEKLISNLE